MKFKIIKLKGGNLPDVIEAEHFDEVREIVGDAAGVNPSSLKIFSELRDDSSQVYLIFSPSRFFHIRKICELEPVIPKIHK